MTGDGPPAASPAEPYSFLAVAGVKYAYCRCRKSARYPLCDGTHRQLDGITPIKVTPEVTGELRWCACGRSRSQPDCDGSHRRRDAGAPE